MPKLRPIVAVVTGDVIRSRRYSDVARRRVDRVLRATFSEAERKFPTSFKTGLAFRITAGAEFQCVLSDVAEALRIVTYARAVAATSPVSPPLRFRVSVGIGEIAVSKGHNSYEQDGTAFARARQGLIHVTDARTLTALVTGDAALDATAAAMLGLTDHLTQGWTVSQWEAIRWAILRQTREQIARVVKVAHQNVTKRLQAAGWAPFEAAMGFLGHSLQERVGTPRRVQRPVAPS